MLHPAVARSFHLMTSSLANASAFLMITRASFETNWQSKVMKRIKALYHPVALGVLREDNLTCRARCAIPCVLGKDMPWQFVLMCKHFQQAWHFLINWEAANHRRFDWVLKVRPDLLWMEPFPKGFVHAVVGVPRGVMTGVDMYVRLNDHVFWCARDRCAPYFETMPLRYQQNCSLILPDPPQRALFDFPGGDAVGLVDVAYTIARLKGPECFRLQCGKANYETGCIAPHLTRFMARCEQIRSSWLPRTMRSTFGAASRRTPQMVFRPRASLHGAHSDIQQRLWRRAGA